MVGNIPKSQSRLGESPLKLLKHGFLNAETHDAATAEMSLNMTTGPTGLAMKRARVSQRDVSVPHDLWAKWPTVHLVDLWGSHYIAQRPRSQQSLATVKIFSGMPSLLSSLMRWGLRTFSLSSQIHVMGSTHCNFGSHLTASRAA
ncbi:hypothetical protein GCM10020218_004330 [Dactylosporangium vinaceum]